MTAFTANNPGARGAGTGGALLRFGALVINSASTRFLYMWGFASGGPVVDPGSRVPAACTLSVMRARLDTAVSGNITFTILLDGVATALTCTITAGNTSASDLTHTVSIPKGSKVSCQVTLVPGFTPSPATLSATMRVSL